MLGLTLEAVGSTYKLFQLRENGFSLSIGGGTMVEFALFAKLAFVQDEEMPAILFAAVWDDWISRG